MYIYISYTHGHTPRHFLLWVKDGQSMFKPSAVVTGLGQALGCEQRVDLGGTPAPWRFLFKHRAFKTEPNCSVFMFLQVIKHATHQHHETGTLDDSPTINKTFQTALLFFRQCHLSTILHPRCLGGSLELRKLSKAKTNGSSLAPWIHGVTMGIIADEGGKPVMAA